MFAFWILACLSYNSRITSSFTTLFVCFTTYFPASFIAFIVTSCSCPVFSSHRLQNRAIKILDDWAIFTRIAPPVISTSLFAALLFKPPADIEVSCVTSSIACTTGSSKPRILKDLMVLYCSMLIADKIILLGKAHCKQNDQKDWKLHKYILNNDRWFEFF